MPRLRIGKLLLAIPLLSGLILLLHLFQFKDQSSQINESGLHNKLPIKIDWVDQRFIDEESTRKGPGEHGSGVYLNSSEQSYVSELMNANGFNALVSDKISLHRAIKDLRINQCRSLKYDNVLPRASIIIPFHNEHWSTLLRTVHSLITRAPESLIEEVILVDDNSTKVFLGTKLDRYVSEKFSKVRILRTKKREGLITARLIGAKAASGTVLIFIDSHCEAGINWLPPLLQPIKSHYKTVTCPFIDVINYNDFSIIPQDQGARGAFDWNLNYKRLARLPVDDKHPEQPFESPVMAGGLFAISKKWFWELGGYDDGLKIWGGEQYELSFKVWMCGGRMVDVPCSRISHVYRKFNPFGVSNLGDYTSQNHKRVAEVWMDSWKRYVYERRPDRYFSITIGDVAKQKYLRQKLKCKSFDWFMNTIAFDLLKHYPLLELGVLSSGQIVLSTDEEKCITARFSNEEKSISVAECDPLDTMQIFQIVKRYIKIKLKIRDLCFEYQESGFKLSLYSCHDNGGNQGWGYDTMSHRIIQLENNLCLAMSTDKSSLLMRACSSTDSQRWTLREVSDKITKV